MTFNFERDRVAVTNALKVWNTGLNHFVFHLETKNSIFNYIYF